MPKPSQGLDGFMTKADSEFLQRKQTLPGSHPHALAAGVRYSHVFHPPGPIISACTGARSASNWRPSSPFRITAPALLSAYPVGWSDLPGLGRLANPPAHGWTPHRRCFPQAGCRCHPPHGICPNPRRLTSRSTCLPIRSLQAPCRKRFTNPWTMSARARMSTRWKSTRRCTRRA